MTKFVSLQHFISG